MTQIGDYIPRPGGGMPGGFGAASWRKRGLVGLFAGPQRPALFSPLAAATNVSFGSASAPTAAPTSMPSLPSLAPQRSSAAVECRGGT